MYRPNLTRLLTHRVIPFAVWVLALGVVYKLYQGTAGSGQASGVAEAREFTISSTETGRLTSLEVQPGQRVAAGQVVASLDTGIVESEIAVAEAELRELEAKIPAERKSLELAGLQTGRTFQAELESIEIELEAARASFARDRAELAALQRELARQKDLVKRQLTDLSRMKDLEVRRAALEQAVAVWPERIGALETREQVSRRRLKEWRSAHAGTSQGGIPPEQLRPLELRISRQIESLQLLKKRLSGMLLRAPADAHVARVVARQGNVLTPGDPVMVMVEAAPRHVIAYLDEGRGYTLAAGEKALIRRRDRPAERVQGVITSVAGTVSQLPARFWPSPTRPRWGREVYIEVLAPHQLDPGEAVDVTFRSSGGGFLAASPASASTHPAGLSPLRVPASLSAISRLEPSGMVWVESLQRYLVASDDTGLKSSRDHAPWLFALSSSGEVDREPVAIRGVPAVNDLEGIASSAGGDIYLIASQSTSRRHQRRHARTLLLRARLEGRALAVTGQVSFHDLLITAARRDPALLPWLGLEGRSEAGAPMLNIEGLAWRGGALLLGLKAPLDPAGRALIWKLTDPGRLFREGSLSGAGLRLWAKARLTVEGRPAGISELLFLDGGACLLAATNAQGGAVFLARPSHGDELQPQSLASYPGLKPEGLSLSPGRDRIVVVFDRQQEVPLWTHLEMPR